jgi:hypothetical protein
MEYQAERGGRVVFQDIAKPVTMEWGSALEAMEAVLELEKTVSCWIWSPVFRNGIRISLF